MSHSIPAIAYPAGKCPAKLKGTSCEEVTEWAEEVFSAGRNNNLIYLPSAIAFFAQQFYNFSSPEYKTVCDHLINRYGSINYYEEEIKRQMGIRPTVSNITSLSNTVPITKKSEEKEIEEKIIEKKIEKPRKRIKLKKKD